MKLALLCTLGLVALAGCTPAQRSPDAIRKDTANATAEVARDTKAVAEGVVDGIKQKGPVNINRASAADLETLPGIDEERANKIIGGRPYDDSEQLVKRHILSRSEYDRIATHVVAR
jgi:DNA uptake protein ComE-like DNA-binding protein